MGIPNLGLIFAGVGVAAQVGAANARNRAIRLKRRQNELEIKRNRRALIRQMQLRRAQALALAQAQGAIDSSVLPGGIMSSGPRLGEALGFQAQYGALSSGIDKAQQQYSNLMAVGGLFGELSGVDYNMLFNNKDSGV